MATKEQIIEKIKEFRLMDDDFMTTIFDNDIELTEFVLRIILDNPDIKVTEVHTQREIKNLHGRSVRLDINAINSDGSLVDIEIQRTDKGAGVKRARYNSSMMDTNTLLSSEDCDILPESYVIFITEHDVLGGNLPIYHAERIIKETGKLLNDGTHIVYVNNSYQDNSPLGKLMHDFACKNPNDMSYQIVADKTRYYKENEEGVKTMCKIVEDLCNQEREEAKEETIKNLIINNLKKGKSCEVVAEIFDVPLQEVQKIKENM
jgi:hypothetical protein